MKRPPGRPKGSGLAITPEKKKEILAVLAVGGTRNDAADYVQVARSTLSNTVKRDEQFSEQVKKAEQQGKIRALTKIHNATAWQAAAWYLERKYPDEFGRHQRREEESSQNNGVLLEALKHHFRPV